MARLWSHVCEDVEAQIADLQRQLQQAQRRLKLCESVAAQVAEERDVAQEELLVAKRNAESWQETAQQGEEERGRAFGWAEATNQRSLIVLEDARRSAAERDAALERAEAAEAPCPSCGVRRGVPPAEAQAQREDRDD